MRLYISATLRNFFDKNEKLETDAKNINEAFAWVRDEYPDAAKVLFDDDGELRSFIRIYAGDNDLTAREKWDDPLKETEEVLLLPASYLMKDGRPSLLMMLRSSASESI